MRPAAVAALVCYAGMASALGFGAIHVHSALNEPLDATIDLVSLTPEERSALDVGMASLDMFQRFGIERTAIAEQVRIATSGGSDSGQVQLRLTTATPVSEPFLRFLIEAETGSGRALREYTILLDPPGRAPAAPAVTRTAEASTTGAPEPAQPAPSKPAPSPSSAPAPNTASLPGPTSTRANQPGAEPASDQYGPVAQGETLSRIATAVRRAGTSLDQMQVAIYRDNPQAFNDNMNVLLRGVMLSIPPVERIRAIDEGDARSVVREQHRDAVSRIAKTTEANTLAEASAPPATTGARLRLEAPRGDASGGGFGNSAVGSAGFGRLTLPDFGAGSESDAGVLENSEPGNDIAQEPQGGDPMVSSGQVAPAKAVKTAATQTPASSQTQTSPDVDVTDVGSDAGAGDDAQAGPAPAAGADASTEQGMAEGDYQPLPSEDVDVIGSGSGEPGLLRPRNLLLLALGGLLGGLLIVWNRRRQYKPVPLNFDTDGSDDAPDDDYAPVNDEPRNEATVYDKPGTDADDGETPAGLHVQEADRQMRLGLFEEARETLEKGLARDPADPEIQDKRLELDYVSGDADAFTADIERFEAQLAYDGVRWAGIASMGRVLLPDDPRFSYPTTTQPEPASEPEPETPQALFDSFATGSDKATDESAASPSTQSARPYFSIDDDSMDDEATGVDIGVAGYNERSADGAETTPVWAESGDHAAGDNHFQWQDEAAATEQPYAPDASDTDEVGFDLDIEPGADREPEQRKAPVAPIDTAGFDLDDDADTQDDADASDSVEVRLDLARMYIDMEDGDTARELLEEAAKEGDETQRATAQELLNTL